MIAGTLHPVTTYEQICTHLLTHFVSRGDPSNHVRLVGVLFARPTSPLAKEEIIPNLNYFHERSGQHVNFYCGGYWQGNLPPDLNTGRIAVANGWMYADSKFDEFRRDVESRTKWRYSGGVDLLITNARFREGSRWRTILPYAVPGEAYLDFSTTISAQLDAMKQAGAIVNVETFFESIFRYAEAQNGRDPTWGFSESSGATFVGDALKRLIFAVLPRGLSADAERAAHFAVADLSTA